MCCWRLWDPRGNTNDYGKPVLICIPRNRAALAKMEGALNTQAQALFYVDVYWLLAVTAALMFVLSFLLEKDEPGASGNIQMH